VRGRGRYGHGSKVEGEVEEVAVGGWKVVERRGGGWEEKISIVGCALSRESPGTKNDREFDRVVGPEYTVVQDGMIPLRNIPTDSCAAG